MKTFLSLSESYAASLTGLLAGLTFFLYVLPLSIWGWGGPVTAFDSPAIHSGIEIWDTSSFHTVEVPVSGLAYVDHQAIPVGQIADRLRRASGERSKVQLIASKDLLLRDLAPVFSQLREAGYQEFWLISEPLAPIQVSPDAHNKGLERTSARRAATQY